MSTPTTDDAILFERLGDHIARITLNRPSARNAINAAMTRRMGDLVREVEADPALRVAILAAADGNSFCAGADLAEIAAGLGASMVTPEGGFAGFVFAPRSKPWIAAVRGYALGGGLEICLACEMIVAAQSALFGLPETKRGVLAAAGGAYRLPRAIPRAVALEMLATGASINAGRAYELGLVNRVVDDAQLAQAAIALAEQIAANSPLSVRESLAIARVANECDEAQMRQRTADALVRVLASEDAREGPRAFIEKRSPVWRS